jgi:deoxyribodipyrimidine photo-lyase
MTHENGLFIFRRDYRLIDNLGLLMAKKRCKNVYTIFIFTPEQVGKSNDYKSTNAIQFMIESLMELSNEIQKAGGKLWCFYGENNKIINEFIHKFNINYVCFNKDYTPYAIERDTDIVNLCKKQNVSVELVYDYYLHEPGSILNGSGKYYQKFTPYYETALKVQVSEPYGKMKLNLSNKIMNISNTISLEDALTKFTKINDNVAVRGGRTLGLKFLKNASKTQKNYSKNHNTLITSTTMLSAYIKFGCISIREVYHEFKKHFGTKNDIIRQLIWRDFYANILYAFPYVLGKPMKPSYNGIKWHKNARFLHAWENGLTGFPVVDAAMREMNKTGYMHNRGRLIVSSFLIKILLIDWREGEKYFSTKLVDYDPASNNGNWQWSASTGADSQPYFRIFNPWMQSKEHDPDAEYIKKWVPELKDVPAKDIHEWNLVYKNYRDIKYPNPIVDYDKQKNMALEMFRSL